MTKLTKNSIDQPFRKPFRSRTRLLVAAVTGCFTVGAIAQSSGFTVVNGTAVASKVGAVTTITNSNGAILNWNQFNIAAGDTTRFLQPSSSSAVLNRVLGSDPSQIYGTLSSNGRVWLINPAGIIVGASGRVDTAGFVASTLGVSNSDFLANRLSFGLGDAGGTGVGAVVNHGAITTSAGGSVYLVAPNVTNQGIITTPQGETILAAGQTVQLIDTATPGVKVEITGAEGNAINLGEIVSDAGRIGIAGVMVKNSGTLNASSVVSEGGRVFLKASQDAYVDGAGRIVTTGTKGGSVEVLGNRVAVMDSASIDASGSSGGGTIKVGGDYQGKNPDVQNAAVTYFGPDASLNVDATSVGAGGTLIVWADDTTRALGSISARGGADGGDGGFVETSGKRYLAVDGIRVDTRARVNGETGTWLLDPSDISIVSGGTTNAATKRVDSVPYGGVTTLEFTTGYGGASVISDTTINSQLMTTDVIIHTAGGTGGNGNIVINGANIVGGTSAHALTLAADASGDPAGGNITVISSVLDVDDGVTMLAGWNGVTPPYGSDGNTFSSTDVINGRGNINLSGATLKSASHGVYLWAGKDVNLVANSVIQASMTEILAGNDVVTNGGRIGGVTSALVAIDIDAGRDISITGSAFETFGGAMTFTSGRDFKLTANVNGGSIVSTAGCSTPADVGCRENPSTFTFAPGGLQTISAAGKVIVEAHPGGGGGVALFSGGGQNITADSVEIRGGLVGNGNDAWITNRSASEQTISARTILLQGGGSGSSDLNNDAGIFSTGLQTINVTGTGGALTMNGGSATGTASQNAAYLGTASGAAQVINVAGGGSITLQGGGGAGSFEDWAMISSSSTQQINMHDGGSIILRGGAGNGSNNATTPADGTSNNYARINAAGAQTISYYGSSAGRLDLYGGTVGNSNYARISQTGSAHQSITGNPIITLTGGDSGGLGGTSIASDEFMSGAFAPSRGNTAIIASGKAFDTDTDPNLAGFGQVDPGTWVKGTQSIDAAEIAINGSSRSVTATGMGGAGIFSAYGQTVNVLGDLKLLGGNATNSVLSSARSRTRLWSMGGEQVITANQLHVIGAATGTNNIATIGSWGNQTINLDADGIEGPALWLQTNGSGATNLLNNSLGGSQTITFTGNNASLKVEGPFSSLGTNANASNTAHPNQSIVFTNGGSVEVIGVGRPLNPLDFNAVPRTSISSSGDQEIIGATSITLTGGNTANGRAFISAEGDQYIEANQITLTGGGGTSSNSYASIEHGLFTDNGSLSVWGTQRIWLAGANASVTLQGGSGNGIDGRTDSNGASINPNSSGNYALIKTRSAGQTISYAQSDGSLSVIGGSNGNNNHAEINASYGQTISGAPNVLVRGGASGGAVGIADNVMVQGDRDRSNHAYIVGGDDDNAGPSSSYMSFNSLTIEGGGNATSYSGAGIEGFNLTVDVAQDAVITGGGSNTIDAGDDVPNATAAAHIGADGQLTMNVGGTLTIAAGTGSSGLAFVGSGEAAAINLSVGGDLNVRADETAASSAGVGSLFGQTTGTIHVGGTANLVAQYGGIVVIGSHLAPMVGIPYPSDITPPGVLSPRLGGGDIAVSNGMVLEAGSSSGSAIHLNASRNINVNGTRIGGSTAYGFGINLVAAGDILVSNSALETNGADMSAVSGNNFTLTATAGNGSIISTAGCSSPGSVDCRTGPYINGGHQSITAAGTVKVAANAVGGFGVALVSGGGQTITADRIEVLGGGGNGNDAFVSNSWADQEITAHHIVVKAGGVSASDQHNLAIIYSQSGTQNITVTGSAGSMGSLSIYGGVTGNNNSAGILTTLDGQVFDISGSVLVQGGGDATSYLNRAEITSGADQTFNIHYGGSMVLHGGAGSGVDVLTSSSNNSATIRVVEGNQTIDFNGNGGQLELFGGSAGTSNIAGIWNSSAGHQAITGNPVINLTGGNSGGAGAYGGNPMADPFYSGNLVPVRGNNAVIAAGQAFGLDTLPGDGLIAADTLDESSSWVKGTQSIDAASITIKGSSLNGVTSTALGGAGLFSAYSQSINVEGALRLLGGDATGGNARSRTRLWSMGGDQVINANQLHVIGAATGTNNIATVGSWGNQTINLDADGAAGPALLIDTNGAGATNVLNNGRNGSQTITFIGNQAGLKIEGPVAGLSTNNFTNGAGGNQHISFMYGGSIEISGANNAYVSNVPEQTRIYSTGDQLITGVTSITLTAGNTLNSSAIIGALGDQHIEANQLTLGGGGGDANDSFAEIRHGERGVNGAAIGSGNQTIVMTGINASITLRGGSGNGINSQNQDSNNYADIKSRVGGQFVEFEQPGGNISIYGGSVGSSNSAGIVSHDGQSITGNPIVFIRGGSTGGANTINNSFDEHERGNDAGIFGGDDEDGGREVSTLNFASLTIQGGTADFGNAGVAGDYVFLDVQGNVSLSGGSSNQSDTLSDLSDGSTAAFIGHDRGGNLYLDIGGNLTMTGGSGVSGPVIIGSIESASVNVNVVGDATITASVGRAVIGSLASATQFGGNTSVSVATGGNVTLTAGNVATGTVVVGSTNNKILFDGCNDGCDDLGTGSVNVELIAARDLTISGQTGSVVVGTKILGTPASTEPMYDMYGGQTYFPPSDPSSHVMIAAGAAYPDFVGFGVGGGFEASGYGGNISAVGPVSIKTDQFSNASIQLDAFESDSGAAGNISLPQGTVIDGDRITASAGGDVAIGGMITGTDKVELAAGWVYNLETASSRGGNLTLAPSGSISSLSEAEVWAAEGLGQPNGNITLDGNMNGSYGVGVWAARDVHVNGSVTAGREGWDAIWIVGGDSDDETIIGNVFFGPNSAVTASNGGVQVRAEGPLSSSSGDIVQDLGSTITANDDIKTVATGNIHLNGRMASSAELIIETYTDGSTATAGNIAIGADSSLSGYVFVSAAGNLDVQGEISGLGDVELAAGWNADSGEPSLRGGNLSLATNSVVSAEGAISVWATDGAVLASGNITLNGSLDASDEVGVWAARDVNVNGHITAGRSGWDAIWLEGGDSESDTVGGNVFFGPASSVSALNDGGVQVRASGPSTGTGEIVQDAGSTITVDDDIKMVASRSLFINGDLTSNNDEIILYTETNGIGSAEGNIYIGHGSALHGQRISVRAAGDLDVSGLVDAEDSYAQLWAGDDGEGETPRGGNFLLQQSGVISAFGEVSIGALAGSQTGTGGQVELRGSINSIDYDEGAVNVLSDRDIVVSGMINNGAGDYYRGIQLIAGDHSGGYGGDVIFTTGSHLDANLSSVRVSAHGGTETAGNINQNGVMWGNYAKLDADGDITTDGTVGGRYYTEFNAGLNRASDRGGDVVFGPTSVVNPNMTVASPNGGVGIVARGGTESQGSVSQNGGVIDGGLEGISILADGDVNLNGYLHSTNEVSVTAGHRHYNDQDQWVGTGGAISFGSASQLEAEYFTFNAFSGSVAQGHIVQSGGAISSLENIYLGADGDITLNGHVQASAIEIDAVGNVMQGSSGLLAGEEEVSVHAGGNVDLLGNITVVDGGEGYVGVFAGYLREYYDESNVYHPGGEQLVRDKHIALNSISGTGSDAIDEVTLKASGPVRATVQHVGHVNASVANAAYGGITITLSGATEPVLHLVDEADSQSAITVNRASGDLLVTDGSVFDAGGGRVALAALSGNLSWAALHAYGGSLSLAAGGTITQSTPIDFDSLTTTSGGATILTAANSVSTYSGTATGTGQIEFDAAGSLVVGNVSGSQLVALSAGGALTQTGTITAGSLFTESASGTTLTGNNSVNSYSGHNSGSGNIAFSNVNPGNLVLVDLMQRQFAVQNDAETGMVTIATSGTLSQSSTVNAASLMTTTVGGAQLGLNNQVFTYSGQNTGNGAIEFRSADAEGLVVGAVSNSATAGTVRLASAGTMTISGHINTTSSIVLNSVGAIVAPGNLTGLTLNSTSVGGADFSGDNQIDTIAALNNSGSGAIELNNIATTLNIAQINNTAGGVGIDNDGAITVSGPVTATGLIGLAAFGVGGDISQTGGAITSGGDVILLADRNVSLNGQTSAVGNASVLAGLNVSATAGGNISFGAASQVSAHNIALIADRDTGSGSSTTGHVSQQASSNLQSSNDFLVNASGNISMLGAVSSGSAGRTHLLAGFNNGASTEQAYTGAQVTASNLQANGGSVSIQATGAVNAVVQSTGQVGVNINNSAYGGLNLTSYGASALVLIDNSVANSGITLNYQNGPLTLGANTALVTANGTGKVSVASNGGNLVYSGANVSASEVRLNSTGAISQTAAITTNTLYTVSAGGTAMTMDNVVGTYSGLNTGSGNLAFKSVKTGGLVLAGTTSTAVQNSAATGDISITSAGAGALTINGMVTGLRNVAFTSAGAINATAKLTGAGLNSVSIGGANFSGPNQFATVTDLTNTGTGNVIFNNTASPLTINRVSNSVGNVTVDNTGAVIISGAMTASGTLSVTAHSPVTVTSTGSVRAGGNLNLTASSSSAASTIDLLTIAGEVTSDSGDIDLFGGSGIVVTNTVIATRGDVSAESPFGVITQNPDDLIRAPNGKITLNDTGSLKEEPIVIPPETIPDADTGALPNEIVVVAVLGSSSSGGPSNVGDSTTGGTSGTFGATEEKKEDKKEDDKKGTAGAEASAEEKPAAQKAVGSCT